ncbi:MAG: AAA family ATPase [Solidesulfovibrio sp.]|uniref:AAA family ATPase n=1 Tax=Solidesulfovibrio sp. TaxID=2910990 RepID=UPI0031584B48
MARIEKKDVLDRLDFRAFYGSELPELRGQGDEMNAPCPFHDDHGHHFYANAKTGFFKCQRCNAEGDVFRFFQDRHGVDFKDALNELATRAGLGNGNGNGNGQKRQQKNGDDHARPILANKTAFYHYKDEQDQYLFTTVRFEEPGKKKTFRQWCYDFERKEYDQTIKGVRLVPYNLPDVLQANEIFLVEGEKDVESLRAFGLVGSCNPMGAGKWKDDYNGHFAGRHVVILEDNDDPGREHGAMVAKALYPVAASVKVVDLPDLPEKGDISDWIITGGTKDALLALADQAAAWKPSWAMDCVSAADFMKVEIVLTPLVDGLLNERESLLICGPSGLGKSVLTLNMALACGLGGDAGLWGMFPLVRPLRTLFIQSENSAAGTQARLRKIIQAMPEMAPALENIIMPQNIRMTGELTDEDFQRRIVDACRRFFVDLLVLDPLISFHGQDENDNASMRRSLDCLTAICDQANVGTIVVHHVDKQTADNGVFSGRGASAIGDWAANILLMKPVEIDGERSNVIELLHQKARNFEAAKPFFLERRADLSMVRTDNPKKRGKDAEPIQVVVAALEGLGGKVGRKKDLYDAVAEATGKPDTSVRRIVQVAVAQCAIHEWEGEKRSRGMGGGYCLPHFRHFRQNSLAEIERYKDE